MAIGVDYVLFWTLNPKQIKPFIEAHKQKQMLWQEEVNFTAWLNGIYVSSAIAACLGENSPYPEKPISFDGKNQEQKTSFDAKKFHAFAIAFNNNKRDAI